MSRLVDYIIDDIRNHTENNEFSDSIGIADSEFLRFLNDAQYRIHNLITLQHPAVFLEESVSNVVSQQESYALPTFAMLQNKITAVEYSHSGLAKDYAIVRPATLRQRWAGAYGHPKHYYRKSATLYLNPVPQNSSAKIRVTYIKSIPRLDKRRGSVSSVTLDSSTNSISALSLNVSTDTVDSTELDKHTRFCIVDEEGNVKMRNIKFTAIDTTTGVVTIDSSFTYASGETITAGNYVVAGANSSTHSILDDMVERYLIAYTSAKIFHRDSSADLAAAMQELSAMEDDIVQSYADITDDIIEIPEIISVDDEWSW